MKGRQGSSVIERNPKVKDVSVRVKKVRPRIDRFRSFQGDEFAKLQVETALADNGKVKVEIPFDQVRLDDRGSRRVAEQTKRVDEARVAPVHELQFETPIELTRLGRECALEIDYELIQQWFIRPIVKEPSEVLIILRAGRIEGDPTLDPTGNLEAWRRSRRSSWFAGQPDTCQNRCAEKLDDLFHFVDRPNVFGQEAARGAGRLRAPRDYNPST